MKKTLYVLAMALMLMPFTAMSQRSDGFFKGGNDNYEDRATIDDNGGGISNWGIGETVPLGSGLLILTAVGAGYAVAKRRRNKGLKAINGLKGINAIILISALLLTMPSCKKKVVETVTSSPTNSVHITLIVDDGSKVIVDPTGGGTFATVEFENDDVIYVGYNNAYVGMLTYTDGTFSGNVSIAEPVGEQPLHFYFLGGKGFTPTISSNTASVVISDQTSKYPVISYNHSKEPYTGAGHYSAKLQNKCSIMKFNVTTPSTAAICISGMNNKVTVNFATPTGSDNGFSYSVNSEDGGLIAMPAKDAGDVTWAIVLPQAALTSGTEGSSFTFDGYKGSRPALDLVESNHYYNTAVDMTVNTFDINYMPLTFEAKKASATVTFTKGKDAPTINDIEFSTDEGATWERYTYGTGISLASASDKVSFRGTNTRYSSDTFEKTSCKFSCSDDCYIYGNIMSLINKDNYANNTTLTGSHAFTYLFFNNTKIYNHNTNSLILPATTLSSYCYYGIFYRCTGLTLAPELPAETLAEFCYSSMFQGCTGLTLAPELPATTLDDYCYSSMFQGCAGLTSAPELKATTLVNSCYSSMFYGCTGLTSAPELPAETLAEFCYSSMFQGCTGLTSAPELPAETLAEFCYSSMFQGCTGLTSAPVLPATTMENYCYQNMFSGCTGLTSAPALPATTLATYCYSNMFNGCTGLNSAPELKATTLVNSCYYSMFQGCTGLTSAPELPASTLAKYCYYSMFQGCTGLTSTPELPATTLVYGCYYSMFEDCTKLENVICLATSGLNTSLYSTRDWLLNTASSGTFTKDPYVVTNYSSSSTEWQINSSSGIPSGWTIEDYKKP